MFCPKPAAPPCGDGAFVKRPERLAGRSLTQEHPGRPRGTGK